MEYRMLQKQGLGVMLPRLYIQRILKQLIRSSCKCDLLKVRFNENGAIAMSDSIISNEPCCLICGTTKDLHKHHIFFGRANRPLSEKYGCWCYLCARHHNMSSFGVHNNRQLDLKLKKQCQEVWENVYGTHEDFMRIFGRNYLD